MTLKALRLLLGVFATFFLVLTHSVLALEAKWLYAGAFKVEKARYCLALDKSAEKNKCLSETFSDKLLKKENVLEQLTLIGFTAGRLIRECSVDEIEKALLPEIQKNEIYGCLPLSFEPQKAKQNTPVKPHYQKYTKLIIRFEQQVNQELLISAIKPTHKLLNLVCEDFNWDAVLKLVQPYLSDFLYTALVMQGESSEYRVSAAALEAMDDSLPEPIRRVLQAMIDADC